MTKTILNRNDPIPDNEFVVRYCRKTGWKRKRNGSYNIKPNAFKSGTSPDDGVSVNWLGYFRRSESESLVKVCETTTYCGIDGHGRFLRLNTTDIRKFGSESMGTPLVTRYRPGSNNTNPSHAEIFPGGNRAFNALAACANRRGKVLEVPDEFKRPSSA